MRRYGRAAFVGEAMIELTSKADRRDIAGMSPAGDVLNTAVYFERASGNNISARFVTVLGGDSFSDRIVDFASSEGLDTTGIRRVETANCGLYAVSTSDSGERSFSYWRSASAARQLFSTEADFTALDDCDVALVTGITLAIIPNEARERLLNRIVAARQNGLRLAFDSNFRPALWEDHATAQRWVDRFWRVCDIAFPSVDDEMALFGETTTADVLERFRGYGIESGALKAGIEGSFALDGSDQRFAVKPVKSVVDTTAAGDSFNAGFLAAHLNGASLAKSIQAAHDLAREVIQHPGAISSTQ